MAPATPRLRILSVGGNAVSAFLSWRLQATQACDVTLVWKSGYESVSQYGISIKSQALGNERFKPHSVVRAPEEATHSRKTPFDYVLLCVKALPDVYDLAAVIESVVTPQHTCILLNTTHALGIEELLEERFPTNVVLSLVCGAELNQLGPSDFEHRGESMDIWVGWANKNPAIPAAIQKDMAEALAMTLCTARVNCLVSLNIRQQQYERMIGAIAFHPASVLFQCPNHAQLIELEGVRTTITGVIDELMTLASVQGCTFSEEFRESTIAAMLEQQPNDPPSVMYQDFQSRRPMEVETYLGAPIRQAKTLEISVPRLEVLFALMVDKNQKNLNRSDPPSPVQPQHPPRTSSVPGPIPGPGPGPRPMMNGYMKPGRGGRAPSMNGPPGMMRRGPPNGFPRGPPGHMMNGYGPNGNAYSRRGSFDGNDLEEFSHVMLYDSVPEGGIDGAPGVYGEHSQATSSATDIVLRERELMLRQREIELREREHQMNMRRGPPPRRGPPLHPTGFEDEDDDDFFDPMASGRGPTVVDENLDMMSITSRRNRKTSSGNHHFRPESGPPVRGKGGIFSRSKNNRSSARLMSDIPSPHDSITNNPLLGYSSNRYGNVDRQQIEQESRQNSMTNTRMEELARGPYGPYPNMRRTSQSPGNPLSPGSQRPSPPNMFPMQNGARNGRPSPPNVRQPIPQYPPGHGNTVAPQQVEQRAGVSSSLPLKQSPQVRSLTGSASASAESGVSSVSARLVSEDSAQSSVSSLPPPHRIAVAT